MSQDEVADEEISEVLALAARTTPPWLTESGVLLHGASRAFAEHALVALPRFARALQASRARLVRSEADIAVVRSRRADWRARYESLLPKAARFDEVVRGRDRHLAHLARVCKEDLHGCAKTGERCGRTLYGHISDAADELKKLRAKLAAAEAERDRHVLDVLVPLRHDRDHALAESARLREALQYARDRLRRDKTGLAVALDRIRQEVAGRSWITEGRGPYEWDDDRYKEEAGDALRTVLSIAKDALAASGAIAIEGVQAADAALAPAPKPKKEPFGIVMGMGPQPADDRCGERDSCSPRRCTRERGHEGDHKDAGWDEERMERKEERDG